MPKRDIPAGEHVDDRGGTFDPVNEQGKLANQKRRAAPIDAHDISPTRITCRRACNGSERCRSARAKGDGAEINNRLLVRNA